MTPDELLARAAAADRALEAAVEAGDRALALKKLSEGDLWRALAKEARLTKGKSLPKLKVPAMTDAHREAISKAKAGGPNMKAARKAGYKTMAELAAALGISGTFLSLILKGEKAMPDIRKPDFKRLTGKDWV